MNLTPQSSFPFLAMAFFTKIKTYRYRNSAKTKRNSKGVYTCWMLFSDSPLSALCSKVSTMVTPNSRSRLKLISFNEAVECKTILRAGRSGRKLQPENWIIWQPYERAAFKTQGCTHLLRDEFLRTETQFHVMWSQLSNAAMWRKKKPSRVILSQS